MKKLKALCLLLLAALPMQGQEYHYWELTAKASSSYIVEDPIDVTVDSSTTKACYPIGSHIYTGEFITKLAYKGYNPGEAQTRHVMVWLEVRPYGEKCVFDGECIIPHGGSSDESITLLDLQLDEPFGTDNMSIYARIECTGEAVSTPLVFDHQDGLPTVTITARSEVAYLDGCVKDQRGEPIAGATVCVSRGDDVEPMAYTAETDADGRYSVRVEHGHRSYGLSVKALGYAEYLYDEVFQLKDPYLQEFELPTSDFTLTDRLYFTAGQQATIILPEAPDPQWGRYYRIDRWTDEEVFFEREYAPQANVPYVIFPDNDFTLSVADYCQTELPEPGTAFFPESTEEKPFGLYGSYNSHFAYIPRWIYNSTILDSTPDCQGDRRQLIRVGAFRAFLVASPYPKLVFAGETDSISDVSDMEVAASPLFDLQGRRVTGQPRSGVYIQDGRKRVVR